MKKLLALFLTTLFLFAFAACNAEDEPPSIYEDATMVITPPGKIPADAKILAELDSFNGEKAVFAYLNGTFYALIGDENKEMSKAEEVLSGITFKQRLLTYAVNDVTDSLIGKEDTLLLSDMDFDGYSDAALIRQNTKDGKIYACWLWDHASKSFNYNNQLSELVNISIDAEKKAVRGITYVNGEAVENVYQWKNRKLTRINEEDLTEKPAVSVEETSLKTAFQGLYGAEPTLKKTGSGVINRTNVTLFEATANNATTKFAVDKTGTVYIDETANGNYKKIVSNNGKPAIGESVTVQNTEADFITFALQLAAKEVGEDNVTKATRTDTAYAGNRLVYVYTVTIYNGNGTIKVAFDDTLTHSYFVDNNGAFSQDQSVQPTTQAPSTTAAATTAAPTQPTTQAATTEAATTQPTTTEPASTQEQTTAENAVG